MQTNGDFAAFSGKNGALAARMAAAQSATPMQMNGDLSLYIHIPFCSKKCPYCHFYVVRDSEALKDRLLDALLLECKNPIIPKHNLVSIYFGGGTPSLFGAERLKVILDCFDTAGAEITLEVNPENIDELESFQKIGINRISFGVQSFADAHLKTLGRTHSASKAKEAVYAARAVGFENTSIDLMYELPHQTLDAWQETLDVALELPITHLSLYNLTIEPHTPFAKKEAALRPHLPTPADCTKMYEMAIQKLTAANFRQYEISAFCKDDLYSRHNTGYWTGRPFLGLGPSAFSYYDGKRFSNVANLVRYANLIQDGKSAVDFEESIPHDARLKELFALRLRMLDGAKASAIPHLATIESLIDLGLLYRAEDSIRLTHKGILFYDTVASEII